MSLSRWHFGVRGVIWAAPLSPWLVGSVSSQASGHSESPQKLVVHEERLHEPVAWTKISRADGNGVLPLRIALRQRNIEHLDEMLNDVAHPESPNYGQHWTAQKVAETFAPAQQSVDAAIGWLSEHGIVHERTEYTNGWIHINTTIAEAEELLITQYHMFKHKDHDVQHMACDSYRLPVDLRDHVDFVMPTIGLSVPSSVASHKKTGIPDGADASDQDRDGYDQSTSIDVNSYDNAVTWKDNLQKDASSSEHELLNLGDCKDIITIDCLRALYNFGPGTYNHTSNRLGIFNFRQYPSTSDLELCFERFTSPRIPPGTHPEFVSVAGGENLDPDDYPWFGRGEANMDIQLAYSIVWPQQLRQYQIGGYFAPDDYGDWFFNRLLNGLDASYCKNGSTSMQSDGPHTEQSKSLEAARCGGIPRSNVISFSYKEWESDARWPRSYQDRQCREWGKLGLQGHSFVFSSGDHGVGARIPYGQDVCLTLDGDYSKRGTRFAPQLPANCPFVTAVGATQLKGESIEDGEAAAMVPPRDSSKGRGFYSGGGFSNVFGRPEYQAEAVRRYLSDHAPDYDEDTYNRAGRGYPDVAAMGWPLRVVHYRTPDASGGTSASAPIFASIINLINEERLRANKTPVGFLNPVLYAHP